MVSERVPHVESSTEMNAKICHGPNISSSKLSYLSPVPSAVWRRTVLRFSFARGFVRASAWPSLFPHFGYTLISGIPGNPQESSRLAPFGSARGSFVSTESCGRDRFPLIGRAGLAAHGGRRQQALPHERRPCGRVGCGHVTAALFEGKARRHARLSGRSGGRLRPGDGLDGTR